MDELALGRLGAPHGVDGRIKMVSYSGETEHLLTLTEVTLKGKDQSRLMHIESVNENGSAVLVKFAGYDSPEAVRALAGLEVWAPRDKAASLDEDEFYYADLVGCDLVLHDDVAHDKVARDDAAHDDAAHDDAVHEKAVAVIVGVCDAGGGDLLETRKPDGSVVYVPFRKEFVGKVDIGSRRVELLAPWLLD